MTGHPEQCDDLPGAAAYQGAAEAQFPSGSSLAARSRKTRYPPARRDPSSSLLTGARVHRRALVYDGLSTDPSRCKSQDLMRWQIATMKRYESALSHLPRLDLADHTQEDSMKAHVHDRETEVPQSSRRNR